MSYEKQPYRFIISGGGTGGHVYPALAIADALKVLAPTSKFLFVGAKGRMEMEKVPAAGYQIEGLRVMGIQRRLTIKNLLFPFRLLGSFLKAYGIVRDFKPDVAIGVGGYASWPTLSIANLMGKPTYLQEQNSYAGLTNKALAKQAKAIFVAYEGMESYFPPNKLFHYGNPLRSQLDISELGREEACSFFGLDPQKPVVLNLGGSLGSRTLNTAWLASHEKLKEAGVQLLWQTGKHYYDHVREKLAENGMQAYLRARPFIDRMDLAYTVADIIVSRSGALSVSELCMVGKPVVFVPSPNVAEDHQTKNAKAIVTKGAAILVKDSEAVNTLANKTLEVLQDKMLSKELGQAIKMLAKPKAAEEIAKHILSDLAMKRGEKP